MALESLHDFIITDKDRLKSKKISLKNASNNIRINVQGKGCVLTQAIISYYVKHVSSSDAFKLDMEVLPVSNIDQCSITTLFPCFKYNGPDSQANMAILEIDLPSGYQADRTSLYKLIDENTSSSKNNTNKETLVIFNFFQKLKCLKNWNRKLFCI